MCHSNELGVNIVEDHDDHPESNDDCRRTARWRHIASDGSICRLVSYGYGYAAAPLYDYAAPAYGYAATAPLYNYAAPAYAAPATAGTTIVIVTQAPRYTAPPVGSAYYNYAPGYWGGYGWGGYGRWR